MKTARRLVYAGMLVAVFSSPAGAAIECKDGMQYNSAANGWIASSYCGDEYVAEIARRRGMNVSGSDLRNNPSLKAEACQFASSDTRINHLCIGHRPEDLGGARP